MCKEKMNELLKLEKGESVKIDDIDEQAYLLVTDKVLGVSDSLEDVCGYLKSENKNGEMVTILQGYKEELLSIEQRLLIQDSVCTNISNGTVIIPQRFKDYNLVQRCRCDNDIVLRRLSNSSIW